MKHLLFILLFFYAINLNAQITFEQNYPLGAVNKQDLRVVKLSASGYKYVTNDTNEIILYNLNHSVWKTIPIQHNNLNPSSLRVYYISEELFNTDPADVEYSVVWVDDQNIRHFRICDESGNPLLAVDSAGIVAYDMENQGYIQYTSDGTKLILSKSDGSASVYSLPGSLTCRECSNGIVSATPQLPGNIAEEGRMSIYPNPAGESATLSYSLPEGMRRGQLRIFTTTGMLIKVFTVSDVFHTIRLTLGDLEAGTYYYDLVSGNAIVDTKKLLVIK